VFVAATGLSGSILEMDVYASIVLVAREQPKRTPGDTGEHETERDEASHGRLAEVFALWKFFVFLP